MDNMGCVQVRPAAPRKEKKKQPKDELDRNKQAEKKRRRLEKALATSAAIISELEKKKQKKKEELQRLDEEGAAIAEAVALQVLCDDQGDSCQIVLKKSDRFELDPWDHAGNIGVLMGGWRAGTTYQSFAKHPVERVGWFVAKSAVSKGLAEGHNASYLEELSDHVISSLVQVLAKEQVPDVLIKVLGSLEESLQISRTVPDGRVQEIVDGLKDVLTASMIRTKDRQELKVSNDFDDEELELLQEEDVEEEAIFLQVSNCIGTLAKLQKSAFASYFNELVPFVTPMLDKALTSEEKCVAICTFNDVAEHCGTSAARYYGIFLPFLIEASVDVDADVRQAAVYGLGICAKNGDAWLEFFIKEALRALNHVISHQSAFQFENRMATDNAISALGKICEYRRDCIDATQVIPVWLCHLPIRNDLREAKVLHQLLFSMVARLDPLLLGQSNQNLPKILSVFAEIIIDGGDLASEEMLAAIPGLLQKLRRAMEPAAFAHLWESLLPESRKILYPVLEH